MTGLHASVSESWY